VEIPWSFFRKAALWLFGISLLAGFGSTALFMGHQLPVETWRIIFILALVVLTITSTVLIPGLLLPNITSPHPEFLSDDLEDEWNELRQRTISRPHVLLLGGVISGLVYLWCVFYYGKLTNAIWFGWMPVGSPPSLSPSCCLRSCDGQAGTTTGFSRHRPGSCSSRLPGLQQPSFSASS
jgi:hypothetical protein